MNSAFSDFNFTFFTNVRRAFLLLTLVWLAVPLSVFADSASREALFRLEQKVKTYELSNGMKVIMYRRGVAPVFGTALSVRVGGVNERAGYTGISHMLEHMAFKGTSVIGTRDYAREKKLLRRLEEIIDRSPNGSPAEADQDEWRSIQAELEEIWISSDYSRQFTKRGARGFNATTGKEITKYFVGFPRAAFDFWCWSESERFVDPVMRQFYRERDVVLEERRMRYEDSPEGKLYEKMLPVIFLSHPYRNPVIGFEHDLRRLTADQTEEFFRKYYVPRNMVLSVVGDVNPDEDIKKIEKCFGRLEDKPAPSQPTIEEGEQEGQREVTLELDAGPTVFLGYRKPQYPHPDDAPISVLLEILSGSKISPLYRELVQKKQIAADLDVFDAPGYAYPNVFMFGSSVKDPYTPRQFVEAFDKEVDRFKKKGATRKQLEIAKRSIAVASLGKLDSNTSLAIDFADSELLYGSWKATLDWYDQVMNVTVEEVNRVAEQYLVDRTRTVGMIKRRA